MRTLFIVVSGGAVLTSLAFWTARPALSQVQGSVPGFVRLQSATPGTPQAGHVNVTGTVKGGDFIGAGSSLTNLDAGNVSSGTLSDSRLSLNVPRLNASNVFTGSSNIFGGFLGVARNTAITASELFGIGNTSVAGFGGMYALTSATGKPYYGYSLNGTSGAYHYLDGATGYWRLYNGGNRLNVSNTGKIGFNQPDPFYDFEFSSGTLALTTSNNQAVAKLFSFNSSGAIQTYGTNTNRTTVMSYWDQNAAVTGYMGVCDLNGAVQADLYVDGAGSGHMVADVKNFRVPNPRNDAEDIYYACVEGPEAAAYVRGTARLVNGRAHVELPEHFGDVTVTEGMTVQLTPRSPEAKGLGYWHGSNVGFDVFELSQGTGSYEFDWEVKCVRKGHEDYQVIRPWTESIPGNDDRKEAWTARLRSLSQVRARAAKGAPKP